MNFYHDLITAKSWETLKDLKSKYDFILIGGWAVFLYVQALKSKDIDLVMDYDQLEKLKEEFSVFKNERLKKYEAKKEGEEIDIYVPFYSYPGLPAEELKKYSWSAQGFQTLKKEVLAVLKQETLLARKDSLKGRKDLVDLVSLFRLPDFDWREFRAVISHYRLEKNLKQLREAIGEISRVGELGLNIHQTARLKKKFLEELV